jgi:hypothetical protein
MATRSIYAVVAAAACLLAGPAFADTQAQGSATIDNFSYQLIDLTPNDGATPWITLGPVGVYTMAALYDNGFDQAATVAEHKDAAGTSAAVNRTGTALGTSVDGFGKSFLDLGAYAGRAFSANYIDFVLAPNTLALFFATGSASLNFDLGEAGMAAMVSLKGKVDSAAYPNGLTFSSVINLVNPDEASFPLTISLSSGAGEVGGRLSLETTVEGQITPVPEPAAAAMLLAGLGLLAAYVSREKRILNARKPILNGLPPNSSLPRSRPPAAPSRSPRSPSAPAAWS